MIQINNLSFSYKKKRPILKDLTLALPAGNIYGLLGKNGAGKSTLLKNIAGLLYPKYGEVKVFGHTPAERQPVYLEKLFFIPEEFHFPPVSVSNYVKVMAPFYRTFSHDQFKSYLQEFELDDTQKLSALSFGQKKKVMISFGLATNSKMLILDEPTNGLDIPSKSQFRKIVASSVAEDQCIIISTHQVRDLANLIDSIVILDKGEIILNKGFSEITDRLSFKTVDEVNGADVLYSEKALGGYSVITRNVNGNDTQIDLEILFNAVTSRKVNFNDVFNN